MIRKIFQKSSPKASHDVKHELQGNCVVPQQKQILTHLPLPLGQFRFCIAHAAFAIIYGFLKLNHTYYTMAHMSHSELVACVDSLFCSMLGEEVFSEWKSLKQEMEFASEQTFVTWLLHVGRTSKMTAQQDIDNGVAEECANIANDQWETSDLNCDADAQEKSISEIPIKEEKQEEIYMYYNDDRKEMTPNNGMDEITDAKCDDSANDKQEEYGEDILNDGDDKKQYVTEQDFIDDSQEEYVPEDMYYDQYQCQFCNLSFRQKANLKLHHNTVHINQKEYKCEFCMMVFTSRGDKQYHEQLTHSNVKKFSHPCEFCYKRFVSQQVLKTHVKSVHYKIADHVCAACEKKFTHYSALSRHVKVMHLGIKPHVCSYCQKKFSCKRNLADHMIRIHKQAVVPVPVSQHVNLIDQ